HSVQAWLAAPLFQTHCSEAWPLGHWRSASAEQAQACQLPRRSMRFWPRSAKRQRGPADGVPLLGLVLTVIVFSSASVLTGAGRSAASTEPHSFDHHESCADASDALAPVIL